MVGISTRNIQHIDRVVPPVQLHIFSEGVGDMKKTKYTFNHFVVVEGQKKAIDPSNVDRISEQCKILWANMVTGKEHMLESKVAQ